MIYIKPYISKHRYTSPMIKVKEVRHVHLLAGTAEVEVEPVPGEGGNTDPFSKAKQSTLISFPFDTDDSEIDY